jgi:hypothetical protein
MINCRLENIIPLVENNASPTHLERLYWLPEFVQYGLFVGSKVFVKSLRDNLFISNLVAQLSPDRILRHHR